MNDYAAVFKSITTSAFIANRDYLTRAYHVSEGKLVCDNARLFLVTSGSAEGFEFADPSWKAPGIDRILDRSRHIKLVVDDRKFREWAECGPLYCDCSELGCQCGVGEETPLYRHGPYGRLNGVRFNKWLIWSVLQHLAGDYELWIGGHAEPLHIIGQEWHFVVMPVATNAAENLDLPAVGGGA